ncbi:MAG: hypothetical protein D6704_04235 [Nitrospirae bacterium]|nr:MAG: hypothetical protein D6704_04235 [Nitrospirota bacterium]
MRKALNNPRVVAGLCVAAAASVVWNGLPAVMSTAKHESPPDPVQESSPLSSPREADMASESTQIHPSRSLILKKGRQLSWPRSLPRDPFLPHGTGFPRDFVQGAGQQGANDSDQEPTLRLQGIMMREKAPIAVINRTIVREGDRVDGYQVVRILSNAVLVQGPEGERWLGFENDRIPQESTRLEGMGV